MSTRFFNPHLIPEKYKVGIKGKKILVVGASMPCDLKHKCQFYADCTDELKRDSSKYNLTCPRLSEGYTLADSPICAIAEGYDYYKGYQAYHNFANVMAEYAPVEEYYEVWDYMAFTEYVQYIVPQRERNATVSDDITERDFDAFIELVTELRPNIVIVWGDVVNHPVKYCNMNILEDGLLYSSQHYLCHMILPGCNHRVTVLSSYHPSAGRHWSDNKDTFREYLEMALNEPM